MKTMTRVLFLVATFGILTATESPAPMEMVVGTWREGHDDAEPRPAESQYFKTTVGGFQLVQGFAGYKWFIEVTKHPDKRLFTRAILENPADPAKPFVRDGTIDPDTPRTTITQGPVRGLQDHKRYLLEFIAYADEQRTQEVDRLSQRIRSHVDTTGPKLLLFARPPGKTKEAVKAGPVTAPLDPDR